MVFRCPGCNTQYAIDDRHGPAPAQLVCPECGTESPILDATRSRPPAPAGRAGGPAAPLRVSPPARRKPASRKPHAVPCPACGHRFVPPSGAEAESTGGSVLVVEDQAYFARLTREALPVEIRTTVSRDLKQARRALAGERFDLVILDLSLEDADEGRTLLDALRRRNIPALIFTARNEADLYGPEWAELQSAGATDILLKGINVAEDLRRKVLNILRRGRGIAPP